MNLKSTSCSSEVTAGDVSAVVLLLLTELGRLATFDKMQIIVSEYVHTLRYVLGARPPENWNRNYSDYVLCVSGDYVRACVVSR